MSDTEFSDLVDYLSGPVTTAYGAKRASQGQTAPWTDVFDTIYLEFGNEMWGGGDGSDPFGGASVNGGVRLGEIAHDQFGVMRANPNFNETKTKLVIGALNFQQDIEQNSTNHDYAALSPYFGNFNTPGTIEDIYGSLFAAPTSAVIGHMKDRVSAIRNGGNGTLPSIYEINFHTTHPGHPT